ncbi:hypothetical protein STEG23_016546, partial [Scotinomys teguina]
LVAGLRLAEVLCCNSCDSPHTDVTQLRMSAHRTRVWFIVELRSWNLWALGDVCEDATFRTAHNNLNNFSILVPHTVHDIDPLLDV